MEIESQTAPVSPPRKFRRIGLGTPDEEFYSSTLEEQAVEPASSSEGNSLDTQELTTNNPLGENPLEKIAVQTDYACLKENGISVSETLAEQDMDLEENQAKTYAAKEFSTKENREVSYDYSKKEDDVAEILEYLTMGCEETKSQEQLYEDFFHDPISQRTTERCIRKSLDTYLTSSGEYFHNSNGCKELMKNINTADFYTIMRTNAELLNENNERVKTAMGKQSDKTPEKDAEANVGASRDAMYELHLNKVTASMITDMRAKMHEENDTDKKRKENIRVIGKMLFKKFFTEQEIRDGFLRTQCKKDGNETEEYDPKRLFIIRQLLYFIITEKEDITVTKFKATINQNNGLQGDLLKSFQKSVIIDYGNYLRRKIGKPAASSSASV